MTDVPTDAEIETWNKAADEIFDELLEHLEERSMDPLGVSYPLWVTLSRFLAEGGWTAEQLASDVTYHANSQQSEGNA